MNTNITRPSLRSDLVADPYRAAPPEGADRAEACRAVAVDGLEAEAEAEPRWRVQRAYLIRGHERDRARREDAGAVERAAVANHLEKTRVVARGRQQACAPG